MSYRSTASTSPMPATSPMSMRLPILTLGLMLLAPQLARAQEAARADDSAGFFARVLDQIGRDIDAALVTNEPPVPVPVTWNAAKVGTLDLGSIALAIESHDFNRDGRDELLVLTGAELLVIDVADNSSTKMVIRARVPLPAKPAVIRSREPVGTIVVAPARATSPGSIMVRTSEQAVGARYRWVSDRLTLVGELERFPLCVGISAELVRGYSHFDPGSIVAAADAPVALPRAIRKLEHLYQLKCRESVGPDGLGNQIVAAVGKDRSLLVRCSRLGAPCAQASMPVAAVDSAGYAFEVTDVDRDGRVEVIASRGQARGKRDRIRAFADGLVWDQWFSGGVIALGSADVDGDGSREVFAALRLEGTQRFSLWQLNRAK